MISGCTFPFLSDVGKTPVFKEVFIISVIGLARTSVDCFKTRVGKGSRQHDLGFDFLMAHICPLQPFKIENSTEHTLLVCREFGLNK